MPHSPAGTSFGAHVCLTPPHHILDGRVSRLKPEIETLHFEGADGGRSIEGTASSTGASGTYAARCGSKIKADGTFSLEPK